MGEVVNLALSGFGGIVIGAAGIVLAYMITGTLVLRYGWNYYGAKCILLHICLLIICPFLLFALFTKMLMFAVR